MKRLVFLVFAGLLFVGRGGVAARGAPTTRRRGRSQGTAIKRAQGGWLGVEIKDNSFVLTFYNAKKKPTPADKTGAVFCGGPSTTSPTTSGRS